MKNFGRWLRVMLLAFRRYTPTAQPLEPMSAAELARWTETVERAVLTTADAHN